MLVAALDCSTSSTSVGWTEIDDTGVALRHAELMAPAAPGHAETLLERLRAVLATGGFDLQAPRLFVFGRGPGTFTGLRIGLSSVKGLCLASGASLVGVSSLEALALGSPMPGLVAAVADARRGELFAGLYRHFCDNQGTPKAQSLMEERVGSVVDVLADLASRIGDEPAMALGSGIVAHSFAARGALSSKVSCLGAAFTVPRPLWLCLRGYAEFLERGGDDLDCAEPVYLREPDARPPKPPAWAAGNGAP